MPRAPVRSAAAPLQPIPPTREVVPVSAHHVAIPWAALIPLAVVELALLVYCLVDLVRHPKPQHLPRWGWVLICLFVNPIGSITYIVMGRSEDR